MERANVEHYGKTLQEIPDDRVINTLVSCNRHVRETEPILMDGGATVNALPIKTLKRIVDAVQADFEQCVDAESDEHKSVELDSKDADADDAKEPNPSGSHVVARFDADADARSPLKTQLHVAHVLFVKLERALHDRCPVHIARVGLS